MTWNELARKLECGGCNIQGGFERSETWPRRAIFFANDAGLIPQQGQKTEEESDND